MKTLLIAVLAATAPLAFATVNETFTEKTTDALGTAGQKTIEAGKAVVKDTEKLANNAIDAVTPDADARKVEVTLWENRLQMPRSLRSGKTGFIVQNNAKGNRSFEIKGEGIDRKFMLSIPPNESKVLHIDLKPGSYKAFCPEEEGTGMSAELSVK